MKKGIQSIRKSAMPLIFLAVVVLSIYLTFFMFSVDPSTFIGENRIVSAVLLVLLMCGATVFAPVAILPSVPLVAPMLGPFLTGFSCWAGWTLGALIAFWIARHGGRPLIGRFVNIEKLAHYESRIPEDAAFLVILALRLVIPVDMLSYALGLFSTVSMRTYAFASALGILWFSFAFSYLGYAFHAGDTILFLVYGVGSLLIFCGALLFVYRAMKRKQ